MFRFLTRRWRLLLAFLLAAVTLTIAGFWFQSWRAQRECEETVATPTPRAPSPPSFGKETSGLQLAIQLKPAVNPREPLLVFHAANLTAMDRKLDAEIPDKNLSALLAEDRGGKQCVWGMHDLVMYDLVLPASRTTIVELPAKHWVRNLLNLCTRNEYPSGRFRIRWRLDKAISNSIQLDVSNGEVVVYEDEWKEPLFKYPL